MTALLSSELLKLRTTRTALGLLIALLAVTAVGTATTIAIESDASLASEGWAHDFPAAAASAVPLFALVFGVLLYTSEFRHGTITPTLLVTPRRERVGIAKAVAGLIAGVFLTVAGLAVAVAVLVPWFAAKDVSLAFDGGVIATALAVTTLAGLWGVLGTAVGGIVRGQVGAIVGSFLWFFVLEPLIGVLTDDVGQYLPGGAANAVVDQAVDIELSRAGGLAITAAYALALTVAGIVANARRDIA